MWLSINPYDRRPIYLQIINQIKKQAYQGAIKPGDELPSVRELANILGVNMHTVRTAYLKLQEQKIISLRLGRRAIVNQFSQVKNNDQLQRDLQLRTNELVMDALLAGFSPDEIRRAVDQELQQIGGKKGEI